jgi:hypothetical protein
VRDGITGEETCFALGVNAAASDNPMQSEMAGHIGSKGNYFCRKCEVGGSQVEKREDDGFHGMFLVRIASHYCLNLLSTPQCAKHRTKENVLAELQHQVKLSCKGAPQPVKDSQTNTGVKDMYTQYWITYLLDRFAESKKHQGAKTDAEIEAELIQWTLDNKDKIYSGFLTTKGEFPCPFPGRTFSELQRVKALTPQKTHRSRSSTPSYLAS